MEKNNIDKEFDVICVGNALIDMFLTIHDANAHVQIEKDGKLSFKLGEKVLLDASSM